MKSLGARPDALLLPWLVVAACGGNPDVAEQTKPPSATVVFRPTAPVPPFGDVPFPSDLYRSDAGIRLEPAGLEQLVTNNQSVVLDGFSALDGFGRTTAATFFVEGEIDPTSLPGTEPDALSDSATTFIVDVDPSSQSHGKRYPALARFQPSLGAITLLPLPGVVLAPGVRHAAVLTRRVHAADGTPLGASPELARIESGAARSSAAEKLYGEALDELVATHAIAARRDVAGLAVYTTSNQALELARLRDRLRSSPELPAPELILDPALAAPFEVVIFGIATTPNLDDWLGVPTKDATGREWPGDDNPTGIAHDAIGAVATGALRAPSFRDPITAHFERDASGQVVVADPTALVPVTLVVPRAAPPSSGYPVVIHGHGLSNHRGSMMGIANEYARAGFAVIGIDDVEHGARGGTADLTNNFKGTFQGPDGFPDSLAFPVAFFAGFSDFVAMRDNFRQTILDQASLVRLVQNPNLDLSPLATALGGGVPKLDGSRIVWSGGSLGGIVGAMTIGVEPEIRAAALQVPGGGFIDLIATNSAKLHALVDQVAQATFGIVGSEPIDQFHPVANLTAAIAEVGDPLAYAPHVFGSPLFESRARPSVLVTYAVYDEVLPNVATHALIRALGIKIADPHLADVAGVEVVTSPIAANLGSETGAAVQYAPANHALGYVRFDLREYVQGVPLPATDEASRYPLLPKSFQIEEPIREHADQAVHFFTTALAGTAEIVVTAPPVADFDGDGVLDADEIARGTNPEDPQSH